MDIPNRVPWVNVAVGILTIISPFVALPSSTFAKWDLVITGIIIAIIAIAELASYGRTPRMGYWPIVNILAGIWLFVSTTWLSGDIATIWSCIMLGVMSIVTALVALSYERLHATHEIQPPTQTHLRT